LEAASKNGFEQVEAAVDPLIKKQLDREAHVDKIPKHQVKEYVAAEEKE
jgi:hypothetical protein